MSGEIVEVVTAEDLKDARYQVFRREVHMIVANTKCQINRLAKLMDIANGNTEAYVSEAAIEYLTPKSENMELRWVKK